VDVEDIGNDLRRVVRDPALGTRTYRTRLAIEIQLQFAPWEFPETAHGIDDLRLAKIIRSGIQSVSDSDAIHRPPLSPQLLFFQFSSNCSWATCSIWVVAES